MAALTRGDIATATRDYLNELGVDYVTSTILARNINLAVRDVNRDTKFYRGDVTINMQTGVREYAMPGSAMDVLRVRIGTGTNRKRLDPTHPATLDRDDGDWEAGTAGTPTKYYTDGNLIGFYPKPHGTAASATVYARCVLNPPSMSAHGSSPTWLPDAYHDTISKRTAINIARGFDAYDSSNGSRVEKLYAEYLSDVNAIVRAANKRSREYRPRITVKGYGTFRR